MSEAIVDVSVSYSDDSENSNEFVYGKRIGEIVRCQYCNKSKEWPNGRWCSLFRASVNTDSYCSFGAKRKERRKE